MQAGYINAQRGKGKTNREINNYLCNMELNFLVKQGHKISLELLFVDATLKTTCNHCAVNGYEIKYRMGKRLIKCRLEDNNKQGRGLIEWMLN